MIQEILINERNASFSINGSNTTNFTMRFINELQISNFSTQIENSTQWYDSALAGVILGASITFILTFILSWWQKRKELKQYEYQLLSQIMKILDFSATTENEITNFINQIYLDPKLFEINSNVLITDALKKCIKKEPVDYEKEQIQKRIKKLREDFKPKF